MYDSNGVLRGSVSGAKWNETSGTQQAKDGTRNILYFWLSPVRHDHQSITCWTPTFCAVDVYSVTPEVRDGGRRVLGEEAPELASYGLLIVSSIVQCFAHGCARSEWFSRFTTTFRAILPNPDVPPWMPPTPCSLVGRALFFSRIASQSGDVSLRSGGSSPSATQYSPRP